MALRPQNIRLSEAVAAYVQRIEREGQAERSVYTAKHALNRFQRAVATTRDPNPFVHLITEREIDNYFFGPNGIRQGIKSVSFNRYRSVLKLFFDYACLMRWTDVNPMSAVGRARPDMPAKRLMLNAGELIQLLEHCRNPIERIGCALGMNTGLRGNDIRHLTIFDANLAGGVIQTEIRKTRRLDNKPITMELHFELMNWLNTYADLMELDSYMDLPDDWLLVPSYRNNAPRGEPEGRVYPRPTQLHTKPYLLVKRPLERMGFPTKGEGFHTLRRSSARSLFESLRASDYGRDHALMIVKDFLNHASVTQTEHYLGLNHERAIRDALLKDKPFLSSLANAEQERMTRGAAS